MSTPVIELLLRQKGAGEVSAAIDSVGKSYDGMNARANAAVTAQDGVNRSMSNLGGGFQKVALNAREAGEGIEVSRREIRATGRELAEAAGAAGGFGREIGFIAQEAAAAGSALGAVKAVAGGLAFAGGVAATASLVENMRELVKLAGEVDEAYEKIGSEKHGTFANVGESFLEAFGLGGVNEAVGIQGGENFGKGQGPGADTHEKAVARHAEMLKKQFAAAHREKSPEELAAEQIAAIGSTSATPEQFAAIVDSEKRARIIAENTAIEREKKEAAEARAQHATELASKSSAIRAHAERELAIQAEERARSRAAEKVGIQGVTGGGNIAALEREASDLQLKRELQEEQSRDAETAAKKLEQDEKRRANLIKSATAEQRRATDELAKAQREQSKAIENAGLAAAVGKAEAAEKDAADKLKAAQQHLAEVLAAGAHIGAGQQGTAAESLAIAHLSPAGRARRRRAGERDAALAQKVNDELAGKTVHFTGAEKRRLAQQAQRERDAAAGVARATGGVEAARKGVDAAKAAEKVARDSENLKTMATKITDASNALNTINANLAALRLPGWQEASGERGGP